MNLCLPQVAKVQKVREFYTGMLWDFVKANRTYLKCLHDICKQSVVEGGIASTHSGLFMIHIISELEMEELTVLDYN